MEQLLRTSDASPQRRPPPRALRDAGVRRVLHSWTKPVRAQPKRPGQRGEATIRWFREEQVELTPADAFLVTPSAPSRPDWFHPHRPVPVDALATTEIAVAPQPAPCADDAPTRIQPSPLPLVQPANDAPPRSPLPAEGTARRADWQGRVRWLLTTASTAVALYGLHCAGWL